MCRGHLSFPGTDVLTAQVTAKAIFASPVDAVLGYITADLSWCAIPWLCVTIVGLATLALEGNPVFPTYSIRMPDIDLTAGLVLPNAAAAHPRKGGAGTRQCGSLNVDYPGTDYPMLADNVTALLSADGFHPAPDCRLWPSKL